ncbi:FAD-dependent oxidoreductase [Verminephrobacter aporrectodeae subsp. tuberculatae]|uniref:FAD-dependent 5-carboxymethylaminomethyl-2-thiouridine(34) oxidoreductase MnmC n=2 Tax=Verminephrobacter aporrectodeae TaxID=1110389 RepID=UPI002238E6FF|nr:FAD-dependent 5-carboxymethylaminomethyl-2-thiouridine(34) oxidoreductase MnmC [Verminephrobacter aporrectodeae]MCW5222881.1 FAD-dependent oxidoreductase [Verminephrobacter aporrectodeae subsp. tuberculatae]MCW5288345.1 FAD-dependent oxidoreductase [Verminephrobacter aporrectodeae subsp. tuberculatae]MCW8200738.1 FAD-dependent oxidoreductase [Verminephrobacter aporrectodeae subsp. tuberculatae]
MPEPVDWLADGTPCSPRFGDRYRSENGGLDQARLVFLQGCGLPAAWAGQAQWRILETGFGLGLNFLVTWAAWRADPQRPTLLHFVSAEAWPVDAADLLRAASAHPGLVPLAQELHRQWWGLLPGVHRLCFDAGRVLLTLCVGDARTRLREQDLRVDCVYLDGFDPRCNPEIWDLHTLGAVARCCRRGTRLATWTVARAVRDALAQCGFEVTRVPGVPPKRANLQAVYAPRWEPRAWRQPAPEPAAPGECLVIGGGIAGAATAASLARRGWQVRVLDQASAPAAGASGIPAGVFAPHVSPDDCLLSRLSRSGVRATLQQADWLLRAGLDWSCCGVLEQRSGGLPAHWGDGPGADWSRPAPPAALAEARLPPHAAACWHRQAGWLRPARMVAALLARPGIRWQGDCRVALLQRVEHSAAAEGGAARTAWQALDDQGRVLAEARTVVIAAGAGTPQLLEQLAQRWPLQAVRGQLSWGLHAERAAPLLPFAANGQGHLIPRFPWGDDPDGPHAWLLGSTFERGVDGLPPARAEVREAHAANWARLQALLPQIAPQLAPAFAPHLGASDGGRTGPADQEGAPSAEPAAESWAAVRCTAPDRLPIVGPVDAAALPGLWVCSAMGARGLTLAPLCGELLAARLQGEPLPLEQKLARALGTERMQRLRHAQSPEQPEARIHPCL